VSPIVLSGGVVDTGFGLELDPTSEDADNVPLDIADGSSFRPTSISAPPPPLKSVWASSFDTEGSAPADAHGYENREVTIAVRIYGTSSADLLAQLAHLEQKEAKINRAGARGGVGGTLKLTFPSGDSYVFDLVAASGAKELHQAFITRQRTEGELTFMALPFARGEEQSLGSFSETTLPWLTGVVSGIKGSVQAAGRLLITATQGDQWAVFIGAESEHYSSAATAALAYEAESRTPLGGAATAVGATGASGGGSNVVRQGTLTPNWQAMLSTQAAGGGAHLTHVGSFQVLARIYRPTTNTGEVSLRFDWAVGDSTRWAQGRQISFDAGAFEGQWTLVQLDMVYPSEPLQGAHSWEGRIVAKSTVTGDDLDVDWIAFVPADQQFCEISHTPQFETPSSFLARDEFDQSAGALTGKTLPSGGTWSGAGDADDFTVETTGHTAQRTAVSDTAPRFGIAGTTDHAAVGVQADVKTSSWDLFGSTGLSLGVHARYVSTSSNLQALLFVDAASAVDNAYFVVSGPFFQERKSLPFTLADAAAYSIRLTVDAAGRYVAWVFPAGSKPSGPIALGQRDDFATGGSNDDGKIGPIDHWTGSQAKTRNYDNFFAFTPTADATIFANQSLELRHNGAEREDAAGTKWTPKMVQGSHLRLAPAAMEGRSNRLFVKAVRGYEVQDSVWLDPNIDDISMAAYATPRYLAVPEP
jgi:hypothetical protein